MRVCDLVQPAPSQTDLATGRGRANGRRAINVPLAVAPGSQFRSVAIQESRSAATTALLSAHYNRGVSWFESSCANQRKGLVRTHYRTWEASTDMISPLRSRP